MTNKERIDKYKNDLLGVFGGLSENELEVAAGLIDTAAYMRVLIEDLQADLSENGIEEEYTNGNNQSGRKLRSTAKLYNSTISKYVMIINKLLRMVPPPKKKWGAITSKPVDPDYETRRAAERAFLEALGRNEVDQGDYAAFIADQLK